MIKVKFNNTEQYIECAFSRISNNVISLVGNIPANTNGFKTYRMNEKQLGDFSDYTTIYRTMDNGCQFSNNGEVYVEPAPIEPIEPIVDDTPSMEDRISALEEAMLEMMMGGVE